MQGFLFPKLLHSISNSIKTLSKQHNLRTNSSGRVSSPGRTVWVCRRLARSAEFIRHEPSVRYIPNRARARPARATYPPGASPCPSYHPIERKRIRPEDLPSRSVPLPQLPPNRAKAHPTRGPCLTPGRHSPPAQSPYKAIYSQTTAARWEPPPVLRNTPPEAYSQ